MDSLKVEVARFCSAHRLRLDTEKSQHFLVDASVLRTIVGSARIAPDDHIVEIGPGIGVLTRELLKVAGSVTAIEVDSRLAALINEFLRCFPLTASRFQLSIIECNALNTAMPQTPYKIVANIPYHITSPLLRHLFLESETKPSSLTLLLQREVAEKICDTENAGMLTILVGLFGKPGIVAFVPPSAFLPPPKVDSAVLHIECFDQPATDIETMERIFTLTKATFSQKRKMLRNTLPADILAKAGIDPVRRPQTLSIGEWIRLAQRE